MTDLFNLNINSFSGKKSKQQDENLYNPGPDQGQNGIYKSVIRFIPWAQDPDNSKYRKYSAKLVNPLTNERLYIDCPSTLGKPSILWSLDTILKDLKTTEPSVHEEISKYFSRSYNYYSPVYIKKDPQNPTLEGKIKIFPYGYTIDNMIQQEIEPEAELVTTQKINPFSLTEGKDFVLVIKRKTKSWRDFSSAKFINEVSPLIITTGGKEIAVSASSPKIMEFTKNFLTENTPDMSQYFFKPWAESDYAKVAEFIKAIIPYKQIIETLVSGLKDEKMKTYFTSDSSISRSTAPLGEALDYAPQTTSSSLSIDFDETPDTHEFDGAGTINTATPSTSQKVDDDLNDIFAGL